MFNVDHYLKVRKSRLDCNLYPGGSIDITRYHDKINLVINGYMILSAKLCFYEGFYIQYLVEKNGSHGVWIDNINSEEFKSQQIFN